MKPNITIIQADSPLNDNRVNLSYVLSEFQKKGFILIRGFPFDSNKFELFTRALCENFHTTAVRDKARLDKGDRYSTKISSSNTTLLGHSEAQYTPHLKPPEIGFFMCRIPPKISGGETFVIDAQEFLTEMSPELRDKFKRKGLTYEMLWDRERWQNEFQVNTLGELNMLLSDMEGVSYDIQGESLHLFYSTNAIKYNSCGKEVFSNGLFAHLPKISHPSYAAHNIVRVPTNNIHFGDGDEVSESEINHLIDVHDKLAYPHRWEANDLLMIDNIRYLHGKFMTSIACERVLYSRFGWLKTESEIPDTFSLCTR